MSLLNGASLAGDRLSGLGGSLAASEARQSMLPLLSRPPDAATPQAMAQPNIFTPPGTPVARSGNSGDPRGIRNNNPLNLEYLPNQGTSGSDGRFGVYPTMEAGVAANARQLLMYRDQHGLNTIADIINRWAPAGENDPRNYAGQVATTMGLPPKAPLNLDDPKVLAGLIDAMARVENGRSVDAAAVQRGVDMVVKPNAKGDS